MARVTKFETDLRQAFERTVGAGNVTTALAIIRGADPRIVQAAVILDCKCYHPPGRHHLMMTALDSLLGTHGIEHIGEVEMRTGPPVEYLNTGDSYVWTLVWYRDLGKFRVQGYVDAVEWCERRGVSTDV